MSYTQWIKEVYYHFFEFENFLSTCKYILIISIFRDCRSGGLFKPLSNCRHLRKPPENTSDSEKKNLEEGKQQHFDLQH